jgi:hypothetical protein
MLVIPSTAAQIRIALSAAPAANQPIIYTTWADVDPDGSPAVFLPGATALSANGTADVTAIGGAGSTAQQRIVKYVNINNVDTGSVEVNVKYYDGSNAWTLRKFTLAAGDQAIFSESAWQTMDSSGNQKVFMGKSIIPEMQTLRPPYGAGGLTSEHYAGFMSPSTYANHVPTLGVIRAYPFFAPARTAPTLIYAAFNCITAGTTAASARIGIYKSYSAENIMPSTLVMDSGDISLSTTGVKAAVPDPAPVLESGRLYWACILNGGASATARGFNAFTDFGTSPLGYITGIAGNVPYRLVTATYAYAAYPTAFPAGGPSTATANNLIAMALRF